jgi:hypothetical protein
LTEVKQFEAIPYAVITDTYAKYIFGLIPRSAVTSAVTKKLPAGAKEPWAAALAFADSDVGASMAVAFRRLCSADGALSHRDVLKETNLTAYAGDFLYLTAIHPPYKGCVFLNDAEEAVKPVVKFVPAPVVEKSKGRKKKKKA